MFMTVKEKVLDQLDKDKKVFRGERLKVVKRAHRKVLSTRNIQELLDDTKDREVRKLVQVIHHDLTRSEEEKELYRRSVNHLVAKVEGTLAGKLLEKERHLAKSSKDK